MGGEFHDNQDKFPMYVLVDEESGDELMASEDVSGFFVDPEKESQEVVFLGVHHLREGRRRSEDTVLQIVNRRRRKIGEYYIGRAVIGDADTKSPDGVIPSVSYRCFGNRGEYPGAAPIWRRWASGVPLEEGEWLHWPVSHHSAWLDVVQNAWFAANRDVIRYGVDEVAYLDGVQISTKPGFFCALGEAVNGPGGYFGSNLDALADCMSSSIDEGLLIKLVWRNFQASSKSLDRNFLNSVMEIMHKFRVDVTLR